MGAPIGNDYAAKGRKVEKLLTRALTQDDARLRKGIEALLDKVAEGERWALEFVRDSLDGKPKQQVDLGNAEDKPFKSEVAMSAEEAYRMMIGKNG